VDGGPDGTEGGAPVGNALGGFSLIGIQHIFSIIAERYLALELGFGLFEKGLPHGADGRMLLHIAAHERKFHGLFGGKGRSRDKYAAKGEQSGKRFDTLEHVGLLGQRKARSMERTRAPSGAVYELTY
jgi:hypothetical protein